MTTTTIEWTDRTWNPVSGCTKVSPGCDNCYAEGIARRFAGTKAFPRGFDVTLRSSKLDEPMRWRKPSRIFVNSMSDLFHSDVPDGFIGDVWNTMACTPQHTYQILTKRPARARSLLNRWAADGWHWRTSSMLWAGPLPGPLPNVWIGTSVEDQKRADLRIPALLETPAAVRFLSCEPLLGPVDLADISGHPGFTHDALRGELFRAGWLGVRDVERGPGIGWVIVGGESGPSARPMHPAWARQLRDQCQAAGVPFFFKQWGAHIPLDHARGIFGGIRDVAPDGTWQRHERDRTDGAVAMVPFVKRHHGRELDGRSWDQYPDSPKEDQK